ncbi:MAG: TolC family protein [Nitrospiraceae bacterium]
MHGAFPHPSSMTPGARTAVRVPSALCLAVGSLAWLSFAAATALAQPNPAPEATPQTGTASARPLPAIPLSQDEVFAWVDRTHPLLKSAGTDKIAARGRLLKAMAAFEPTFVNDTEMERFISSSSPQKGTQMVGFNDTFVDFKHPSGIKGLAGFRSSLGDARIPDLKIAGDNQLLIGASIPLLRGLMVNPESAEMQRSELADPRADIKIAETRQGLFLAAATQLWDWTSAAKFVDVAKRAVKVAEDRLKQIDQRAKAGAAAPLDAVEAAQEVQRRKESAIAAQRLLEQESMKMSLFLWDRDHPAMPALDRVPDFPDAASTPTADAVVAHKLQARAERPELREIDIEAKLNNIDLALAKNNLLPSLDADATPSRTPEKFVLGLGYKFGLELRVPLMQRRGRGEVLEAQGRADRLVLTQKYREQQILVDVDNALSAIERAKERTQAAAESLRLARTLEEGERFRFSLGATSVLFVNLRERNTVDSEVQLIRAKADLQKALANYQWAIGAWARNQPSAVPVQYKHVR